MSLGLTVELYIETSEYIHNITEGAGAIIAIHDQEVVPLPDQFGYLVPPGFETRIGVTRVRLLEPQF